MDDIEKSRIRLEHWIDHNLDHLTGYREVAEILGKNGAQEAADRVRRGIELMELAGAELEAALGSLSELRGSRADSTSPAAENHRHESEGSHSHDHSHSRSKKHGRSDPTRR